MNAQATQIEVDPPETDDSLPVCECGDPFCHGCEPEPWTWDAETIADVRFHEMREDGEI